MKVNISASFNGVISRGSYENSRPGFAVSAEFDLEDGKNLLTTADEIQKKLHSVCYQNFKACEEQFIIERVNKERADMRFYPSPIGKIPSVTSIIGFDADMYCPPEELAQYASQSNICHEQVRNFIKTGEWKEAKDLDTWSDMVIVKKGSLMLETDGWSFPDLLEKYPIKDMKNSDASFNEEFKYAGTPDFIGIPEFEGAEKVPTIFDVKRTADKNKNFKQMAAYAKMKGYEDIKQMCIIILNNKTKQGFSKPIVEKRIDQYFGWFLKDRESFRKRFGV